MAAGMGVGAGLGIMGGTLGGIGDIIQAQNYKRPHLEPATGREKRLRDLAQSQLLAGGQQLLGGTALYNQMVPMLMGMLPGMKYHPGTPGAGAGAEGATGGGSPMADYQAALRNMQRQQGLAQQQTALRAKMKAYKKAKEGGGKVPMEMRGQRKATKQQLKDLSMQLASMPSAAEFERQQYMAGVQPANTDIYNIRQAAAPSMQESLAAIQGAMDAARQRPSFDVSSIYSGAGGGNF